MQPLTRLPVSGDGDQPSSRTVTGVTRLSRLPWFVFRVNQRVRRCVEVYSRLIFFRLTFAKAPVRVPGMPPTGSLSSAPPPPPVFCVLRETLQHIAKEVAAIFRYSIMQVMAWMTIISPVDCAIPWKGARIISEWTSPSIGESRPWLYRAACGLVPFRGCLRTAK